MSDVDAAIIGVAGAIAVTIIGSYVAYRLAELSANRALRQETLLRPYSDNVTALKAVYVSLADCAYKMYRSAGHFPKTREEWLEMIKALDTYWQTMNRNGIWINKVEPKLLDALGVFNRTVLALQIRVDESVSGVPTQGRPIDLSTVPIPWDELLRVPAAASRAIADELKIEAFQQQLESLLSGVSSTSTSTSGTPPVSQTQGPNPNRDIDLLKVNLAADFRLGMLVGMVGVYFGLIVALLVAWYETFASKPGIFYFYYTGIGLIAGILGAMLVTQELIPYKNWLKQVDGWLKKIENNERISDLIKLVALPHRVRTLGHFILILMVLIDFFLTILGYPPVELFLSFSAVGITVAFLTGGGVSLVRKRKPAP